jgi:hypothetical protein
MERRSRCFFLYAREWRKKLEVRFWNRVRLWRLRKNDCEIYSEAVEAPDFQSGELDFQSSGEEIAQQKIGFSHGSLADQR